MNAGAILFKWWKYLVVFAALGCIVGVVVYWALPPVEPTLTTAPLPDFQIPAEAASLSHQQIEREGERVATQLLKDQPQNAEAFNTVAYYFAQCSKTKRAIELYRQSLVIDKSQMETRVQLARLLRESGDAEQALQTVQNAVDDRNASHGVYVELALAMEETGKHEEAVAVGRRGVDRFPRDAGVWQALGQIYAKQQKPEEARGCFRKSIELDTEIAANYFALADVLRQLGEPVKAAGYSAMYAEKSGIKDTAARETRTQVLRENTALALLAIARHYQSTDGARFITLCQRAAELTPDQMLAYHMAGALYIQAGRLRQAKVLHEHLVQAEPQRAANYLNLATSYAHAGEDEKIEATLASGVEQCPGDAVLRDTFALLLMQADRLEASREQITQAVRIQPTAQRYLMLAIICDKLGDEQAALVARKRAESY